MTQTASLRNCRALDNIGLIGPFSPMEFIFTLLSTAGLFFVITLLQVFRIKVPLTYSILPPLIWAILLYLLATWRRQQGQSFSVLEWVGERWLYPKYLEGGESITEFVQAREAWLTKEMNNA